jgi:eukaryotic-like serine/threonine-protein kinase
MLGSRPLWKFDKACPILGQSKFCSKPGVLDDVNSAVVKRIGIVCFIYAFSYFTAYFGSGLVKFIQSGVMPEYLISGMSLIPTISILFALVVLFVSHSPRLSSSQVIKLGLIFEVVGAAGISIATFWGIFPATALPTAEAAAHFMNVSLNDQTHLVGVPWTCMWIISFASVAPGTIKKTSLFTFAAASTDLVVVLISRHVGVTSGHIPVGFFVRYFLFTTYLCAVIACFAGHGIHKMNDYLQQAREFGSYRLKKLLGKGGMGEVWLAEHNMLVRPAAIKLVHSDIFAAETKNRDDAIRRFKREAQATSALRSCHTIDIYDFGVSHSGAFYYVMELLDGLNLDQLVKQFGPISSDRTIGILRQVCHSLMDAHEHKMIHRDIKPANIYICRLGPDYDFIKVLDFGLVKLDKMANVDLTQATQFGSTIGSPGFMAPEMALGKKEIDHRTDLYALGCVAYWLLTGQLVFEGDSSIATLVQQVQAEPVPPSQRTEIEIPPKLEEIILSLLAKDPEQRPQSARDIDQMLAEIESPSSWTKEAAKDWWDLHIPPMDKVECTRDDMPVRITDRQVPVL